MKKTKGFTLIEIVVAAVIVSVLAAMAVTGHQKLLLREREKRVLMNLRTLSAATAMIDAKTGTAWIGDSASQPGPGGSVLQSLGSNLDNGIAGLGGIVVNDALGTDIETDPRIRYSYRYISDSNFFSWDAEVFDASGGSLFEIRINKGEEPCCSSISKCPATPSC